MPGFLIPLAGLALGALGRLITNRRSQQSLGQAEGMASTDMPSETGMSTESGLGPNQALSHNQRAKDAAGAQTLSEAGVQEKSTRDVITLSSNNPQATQPATGPVQQNKGPGSPPLGGDAGLGARLGRKSAARSKQRDREQQSAVSNAALK